MENSFRSPDAICSVLLAGLAELPDDYEAARSHLLPLVRSLGYHGLNKLRFQVSGMDAAEIPNHPLAEHLAVSLAYDSTQSIRPVSTEELSTWNKSFDEALTDAIGNLRAISQDPFEKLAPGAYKSPWCDSYDASRLILVDLMWALDEEGDYVAAAPDRNTLLVTGSQDLAGL